MSLGERLALPLLRRIDPETAHRLALKALWVGLGPRREPVTSPRLGTRLAGIELANPLGLAAGFDKNAEGSTPLLRAGFGFVEVGAVTPLPQPGNPRPRLFRLAEDRAVINRFGFNNDGVDAIAARLAARPPGGVVGLNIGANKDSPDRAADYARGWRRPGRFVDIVTVNISSPNTGGPARPAGRARRSRALLGRRDCRPTRALARPVPLFLKIAPDLTTPSSRRSSRWRSRPASTASSPPTPRWPATALRSRRAGEAGGLSGAPLLRPLDAGPCPRLRADARAAAADRRRRHRLGRGRLRQDPRRRLGRAALLRAGLWRARRWSRASSLASMRSSPATASRASRRRWAPAPDAAITPASRIAFWHR